MMVGRISWSQSRGSFSLSSWLWRRFTLVTQWWHTRSRVPCPPCEASGSSDASSAELPAISFLPRHPCGGYDGKPPSSARWSRGLACFRIDSIIWMNSDAIRERPRWGNMPSPRGTYGSGTLTERLRRILSWSARHCLSQTSRLPPVGTSRTYPKPRQKCATRPVPASERVPGYRHAPYWAA